jgi:hypothetical protein
MPLVLLSALSLVLHSAPPTESLRLVFGGDVIPHAPVKRVAQLRTRPVEGDQRGTGPGLSQNHDGWDHVLGPLGPILRRADIAMVNLETPVSSEETASTGELVFNAPPSLLHSLKANGVSVATFANNHSLDQGPEGIVETRQNLALTGLLTAGASVSEIEAWRPLRFERRGLRCAVLAMTRWLSRYPPTWAPAAPHVPFVPYSWDRSQRGTSVFEALERVHAIASTVDVLIVAIHWGNEYETEPSSDDRALARALADAGALLIIGHHPHVLQPVEVLRRVDGTTAVVAFSLGNLVSNQGVGDDSSLQRDGLLLEVDVARGVSGTVEVTRLAGVPTATENRLGRGTRRNVQAVVLDHEVEALSDRLDDLFFRKDGPSRSEQRWLVERLETTRARRARILGLVPATLPHSPSAKR